MTKGEIKAKIAVMERMESDKESHRDAFEEAKRIEHETRKDLDSVFRDITGSDSGIVMIEGKAYSFGSTLGIRPVSVVDLDVFIGPDVPDPRCVKSINPDFNPADVAGIDAIACGEVS